MAGTSDSKQPDDLKLHLEQIRDADDARAIVPEGETDAQRKARESLRLRPKLRARVGAVLRDLQGAVPGLSAAETKKLLATRASATVPFLSASRASTTSSRGPRVSATRSSGRTTASTATTRPASAASSVRSSSASARTAGAPLSRTPRRTRTSASSSSPS